MYRQTAIAFLLTFVVGSASAACNSSSPPTGPSTPSVSGTWSGSITSKPASLSTAVVPGARTRPPGAITTGYAVDSDQARITLSQTDSSLSGSWSTTGPNGTNGGTLTGFIDGSAVSMTLSPSSPTSCPYTATVTVSGNSMTGTYAAFNCTDASAGGIALMKE